MKHLLLAIIAISTVGLAQTSQPAQPAQKPPALQVGKVEHAAPVGYTPTQFDMYCSGYITSAKVSDSHYLVGGHDTHNETQFGGPSDRVFIHGSGPKVGEKWSIVRPVKDPNLYEPYKGLRGAVRSAGTPYFELGYVTVLDVQKNIAIAQPELSCGEMKPGDLAIPFEQRETPVFRRVKLDQFTPSTEKTKGRIVMADEFDILMGSKSKVYVNIGSDKGLKVGDYLRITRNYGHFEYDPDAAATMMASIIDDTQTGTPKFAKSSYKNLPRLTVGDMVILHVHPHSATGMIVTSLQDIHPGDDVELMDVSDAPVITPVAAVTAPEPAPLPNPPMIACVASPSSVHPGEPSVITCDATSPDDRPVTVRFTTSAGRLTSSNNKATLDTSDTGSGPISVHAVATDDRNLTATATATVNVEQPVAMPAPETRKLSELDFKPNSARVDNRAKAILDDVALKMQQDPSSTLVLSGGAAEGESPALATTRATNAEAYLTKSKGIDSKRITSKAGKQKARTTEIWSVPPGGNPPQ